MDLMQVYHDLKMEGDYKLKPILDLFSTSKKLDTTGNGEYVSYYVDFLINNINQQGGQTTWMYLGHQLVFTVNGDSLRLDVMKDGLVTNMVEVDSTCPLAFLAERICTFTKTNYVDEDSKLGDVIWLTAELIDTVKSTPFFIGE